MGAGVAQVMVGVVLEGLGPPPYGPQAWLKMGSVSIKKNGQRLTAPNTFLRLTNRCSTLLVIPSIILLRRGSGLICLFSRGKHLGATWISRRRSRESGPWEAGNYWENLKPLLV